MINKKAMVTGSRGFIGSHLVVELKRRKAEVVCIDKELGHDILDRDELYVNMQGVDYVFHMAVLPYVPCSISPRECVNVNIVGTLNVAQAAIAAKVKKIVFSSASAVYGDSDMVVDERHPMNAKTLYGASKLMGELVVRNLCEKNGVDYVILRYMNVYGQGQKNGLIPVILNALKDNAPPTIRGDGLQSFDFVHVNDVVAANVMVAESEISGEAFNIGGENEYTVKQTVEMMLALAHSKIQPIYDYDANVESIRRVGDSVKALRMFGYKPKIKFEDGIKELILSL